eukprot:CAMPEP_0117473352 /NCGR_PEP_ID=MMETSP0784-20121206/8729_1 /TAXON_ID=39447 /ORGANISM="" /LENGTH=798 /DNA_ID=CAMNT_0005267553 /DNA_START=84 /DNA_END=2480 /DNA_ORIENTATION=+
MAPFVATAAAGVSASTDVWAATGVRAARAAAMVAARQRPVDCLPGSRLLRQMRWPRCTQRRWQDGIRSSFAAIDQMCKSVSADVSAAAHVVDRFCEDAQPHLPPLDEHAGELNAIHLAASFLRLGKLWVQTNHKDAGWLHRPAFIKLTESIKAAIRRGELNPRGLSNILLASAWFRIAHPALDILLSDAMSAFARSLTKADAQSIADTAWVLATLKKREDIILHDISRVTSDQIRNFRLEDLQKIAWAFATLCKDSGGLFRTLATEILDKTEDLGPWGLSSLAWAFAKVAVEDAPLFRFVTDRACATIAEFRPRDLCNLAWAFAALAIVNRLSERLHALLATEAATKVGIFMAQDLSNFAWALARLSALDETLCRVFVGHVVGKATSFKPQELSNLLWAFATARSSNSLLFCSVFVRAMNGTAEFKPQEQSNVLWAFAATRVADSLRSQVVIAQVGGAVERFNEQELSNIAWAFAKVGANDHELFQALARASLPRLRDFTPQGLSTLAWAFATSSVQGEAVIRLARGTAEHGVECLAHFGLQELANLCWALVTLGFAHGAPQERLLSAASTELAHRLGWGDRGRGHCDGPDMARCPAAGLAEMALNILGATWALHLGGFLGNDLAAAARGLLLHVGRVLDGRLPFQGHPLVASRRSTLELLQRQPDLEPWIAIDLPDRLVAQKPDGWEVDNKRKETSCHALSFSKYVRSLWSPSQWPIVHDATHELGFLHRLDVPGSGLILVAKSYEAYYDLQLQLSTGEMARDLSCSPMAVYLVGAMPSLRGCSFRGNRQAMYLRGA